MNICKQSLESAPARRSRSTTAHMTSDTQIFTVPFNYKKYNPNNAKLSQFLRDARSDVPLRAKSVCLAERPRSQYGRNVRSADPNRLRYGERQFYHRPQSTVDRRKPKTNSVFVKQQNRKVVEKVPCAISVQTLSIPMKYADNPKPRHLTSKRPNLCNSVQIDNHTTKSFNPSKQVSNKRLCQRDGGGKETENKLLLQISEAEQVSDFERILNSNAILWERAHGHVWRGSVTAHPPTASLLPRPRSCYSLNTVSQAYHYLFRQHEESLQPLIDKYRKAVADGPKDCPPTSLLEVNWYENLQHLSEFYEDDQELRQELDTITDRLIAEEVKATEEEQPASGSNKNFNVNLTHLLSLHVNGERFSPSPCRDDIGPSPDIDTRTENEVDDGKEWLAPSMSANIDDRNTQNNDTSVDNLAQNLDTVKIDIDAKVPTITYSNCCEGCTSNDSPDNTGVVIHLAVPPVDSIDESRPPMM